LKDQEKGPISRHFLALTQKLMPLRIACAGGHIPLDDDPTETEVDGEDGDNDEDEDAPKKKKPKKFSEFAFTSKLNTLISELERLRTDDPTGTYRVCVWCKRHPNRPCLIVFSPHLLQFQPKVSSFLSSLRRCSG
jgi:hypothetical protein